MYFTIFTCVLTQRLFTHVDNLLQLETAVPAVAEVLAEVFAAGAMDAYASQQTLYQQLEKVHMQVREDQIEKIFELIAENEEGRPKLLYALQYIAKVTIKTRTSNWMNKFTVM